MMLSAAIYFLGGLAAAATLLMIFQRDPVKAAMLMLAALLSTAGIYLALSAQLLAALQIILYAGAVMTLFIVALTVTPAARRDNTCVGAVSKHGVPQTANTCVGAVSKHGVPQTAMPAKAGLTKMLGPVAAAVILAELLKVSAALKTVAFPAQFSETGASALAAALFGRFAFQFELLSIVILTAIVGVVALAGKRRDA